MVGGALAKEWAKPNPARHSDTSIQRHRERSEAIQYGGWIASSLRFSQ